VSPETDVIAIRSYKTESSVPIPGERGTILPDFDESVGILPAGAHLADGPVNLLA